VSHNREMEDISDKPKTDVAQVLKKRRQALKLSLADVELSTKIRGKYLVKLEKGDYSGLPNDIYTRGFVRNYAAFLNLDVEGLERQYLQERGAVDIPAVKLARPGPTRRLILTPKLTVLGAFLICAVGVVTYLYAQFTALAAAPKLDVSVPLADQEISGSLIDVAGHAGGGSDVFINDSPVLTDSDGNFSTKLALQDGVNQIKVTARNKVGKTTTVNRNVLAKLPNMEEAADVASATFDGVSVGVTIKGGATGLVVTVDGKEEFNGTMLDGTAKVFRAAGRIKITTTNAGNTNLVITNSAVVRKALSPLGKDGEVKRNLEFAKDTNFQ
jgi:cytoskeletal protein RodZ